MTEDIRYHIRNLVNEVRHHFGVQAELHLHEDESRNCRAHADYMAKIGSPQHSRGVNIGEWSENVHAAWGYDNLHSLVGKMIRDYKHANPEEDGHLQNILRAKQFVAADISWRARTPHAAKEVFVCIRFK